MINNDKKQDDHRETQYSFPVKRPLGRILLDGEFIKPEELDAALAEQMHTNKLLGDILVGLGVLSKTELYAVLWIQRDFSTVESAIMAAAGLRHLLGEMLLTAYCITPDQLEKALEEQKKTGEKLGEILVRFGFIDNSQRDVTLSFQSRLDERKVPSCLMLGELLISAGYITHQQLEEALKRQRESISDKKIGEILVAAGYAKQHHIDHGLRIQEKLVAAALIAALSLTPISEAVAAQSSIQAMSTQIQVTARVLARASVHVLRQPAEIVVTDADIKRGYLDVNAGSVLEIRNNSRAGVNMTFETSGLPFKEALITGLGREVVLGPNGGIITQKMIGTSVVALSYRFIFDESSQAGTYSWPLSVSVNPVE
ncbi:MAG: hypothetical protein APR62_04970 [Smithella sp. SDB]|nr:MAG: hypothetical protein APR62_04970 [Smithella sp. SDB]